MSFHFLSLTFSVQHIRKVVLKCFVKVLTPCKNRRHISYHPHDAQETAINSSKSFFFSCFNSKKLALNKTPLISKQPSALKEEKTEAKGRS